MMTVIKAVTWGVATLLAVFLLDITWDTLLSLQARGDVPVAMVFVVFSCIMLLIGLVLAGIAVLRIIEAHNLFHSP